MSQYQKGKTNLDFTEARDSEWQWHQLGHIDVVCASGRVGRSLSFGRFFVVFAVFDIVYIHYYRTNCFTTLSG